AATDPNPIQCGPDRDNAAEAEPVAADEPDLRQVAAAEPPPVEPDTVHSATAEQTADAVRRAQRAIAEMRQRQAVEDAHAAEEAARATQLTRWHARDAAERETTASAAQAEAEPALDV